MSDKKKKRRISQMCREEGCDRWPAGTCKGIPRYCMKHMEMRLGKKAVNHWKTKINEKNKRLCDDPDCPKDGCTRWVNDSEVHYLCRRHYNMALSAREKGDIAYVTSLIQRSAASVSKSKLRSTTQSATASIRLAGKTSCATNKASRIVCNKRNCLVLAGGASYCNNDVSRYRDKSVIDNEFMVEEFSDGGRGNGLRVKTTCTVNFEKGDIMGSFWAKSQSCVSSLGRKRNVDVIFVLEVARSMLQSVTTLDFMRAGKINHRCANANCRIETVQWFKDDGATESFVAVFAESQITKGDVLSIQYGTSDVVRRFFESKGEECKCGDKCCISSRESARYH